MQKTKKRPIAKKRTYLTRPLVAFVAILLLLAVGAFFLLRDHNQKENNKKPQPSTVQHSEPSTPTESDIDEPDPTPPTANTTDNTSPKDQTDNNTNSGSGPVTPYGNFVSNHRPELESSWGLNQMQSVCNTTAGASCQISFTKNGVEKTLPSKKADGQGAAYWSWTLQEIGLTEGTWKVTATATLNGKTASADDPISLEVKQ